ncbi:MAG: PilZ domain-containing protein [Parvularculaceae bacterium]|nr:MAG: PilZ domain-containing protein [Parvularculaceae bacterium]
MRGQKQNQTLDARLRRIASRPVNTPPKWITKRDNRKNSRQSCYKFGILILDLNREIQCVIRDLSTSGARINVSGNLALPPRVLLKIKGTGATRDAQVIWQNGGNAGLAF